MLCFIGNPWRDQNKHLTVSISLHIWETRVHHCMGYIPGRRPGLRVFLMGGGCWEMKRHHLQQKQQQQQRQQQHDI